MLGEQKAFTAKEPLLATLNDSSEIVRTAVIWTLRELEVYGEEEPVVKLYPPKKVFRSQKDVKVWYATPPAPLGNLQLSVLNTEVWKVRYKQYSALVSLV